jgi:sugar phosphate isomerase/epimerase
MPIKFPSSFSIISDEISQDLPEVKRFVKSFGFSGFELRSMAGRAFKDLTKQDVAEVAALTKGEGWKIHGCSSPVFKCDLDKPAEAKEHVEIFKRSIETAKALNCDLIRVFTFLRQPKAPDAATIDKIAGHLRELIDLASAAGIRVGVENESSCIIGTPEEVLQLIPKMPAKGWGIIWDPCNVLFVPGSTWPTKHYAALAPKIIHIHAKDAIRRNAAGKEYGADPVPVGIGEVNWRSHLQEIEKSGYQGLISLETHWRVVQIDEKLLHLPAGYNFSKGAEEASVACLRNLQALCGLPAA